MSYDLINSYYVWEKRNPTRRILVRAWSRKNARLSGSRKLGVKIADVQVSGEI